MVTKFCLGMAPCGIWIHRTGFDFFVFFFSFSSLLFGIAPAYWGRISKFLFVNGFLLYTFFFFLPALSLSLFAACLIPDLKSRLLKGEVLYIRRMV